MDKNVAKQLIIENQHMIQDVSFIRRAIKFEQHCNYVLVGLRRAGKSYLLYQRVHELQEAGHKAEEILYFNFEDDRLDNLKLADLDEIKQAYEELYEHKPIFMLDEIQIVDGWEKFARRLADQKYQVYITGSNAKMLSSEISTTLGGRYMVQPVYPFSFAEYLHAKHIEVQKNWEFLPNAEIKRAFNLYLHDGGLPELCMIGNDFKRQWLGNLYNKIYFGDLVARYNVRNTIALKTLVRKIAESVKQPQSYNRLANLVSTVAGKVKQDTVADYVEHVTDTCLVFPIENIAAKLQEKISVRKYYFTDNGLLNLFLINADTSLLENIVAVFLHETCGEDLFYYNENIEVDFCLFERCEAIQVAYSVRDESTRERETKALVAYNSRFPGCKLTILTMDEEETIVKDGVQIEVKPVWKWMLKHSTNI